MTWPISKTNEGLPCMMPTHLTELGRGHQIVVKCMSNLVCTTVGAVHMSSGCSEPTIDRRAHLQGQVGAWRPGRLGLLGGMPHLP